MKKYLLYFLFLLQVFSLSIFMCSCESANPQNIVSKDSNNTEKSNKVIETSPSEENKIVGRNKTIILDGETFDIDSMFKAELIRNLNIKQMAVLRNSIFAKYGYKFNSTELETEFSKYEWYTPQFDNVDKFLNDIDKANINLILKLEGNFTALSKNLTDEERKIVGFWHVLPYLPAGYSDSYSFFEDRTYKYYSSQMDGEKRLRGMNGYWYVLDNKLFIQITSKEVIIGGELDDSPSTVTGKEIVNGKIEEQRVEPPEVSILPIDYNVEKADVAYIPMKVGDKVIYKFSDNPKHE